MSTQVAAGSQGRMSEPLLNEKEAARFYGISALTLRKWRTKGKGPRYVRIGTCVRYRYEDLVFHLEHCPTGGHTAA
jgi:predicted DNA-binding transcriptional regulator AlpA